MEEDVELPGADRHVKLEGEGLWEGRVDGGLPAILTSGEVAGGEARVLAGNTADAKLDLAHSNLYRDYNKRHHAEIPETGREGRSQEGRERGGKCGESEESAGE